MPSRLRLACGLAFALVAVGCGPISNRPADGPPAEKRSQLFVTLEDEPKAGQLHEHFSKKFPTYTFQVVSTERKSSTGTVAGSQGGLVSVSVTLVVKNPGSKFDDEVGPLFAELQSYLEAQVGKSGMQLNGPTEQHTSHDKPIGFGLGYRSATHKGGIIVSRPTLVPGGLEMRVYELE